MGAACRRGALPRCGTGIDAGGAPGTAQKVTESPFEKLEAAPSRYHSWKNQVSPNVTDVVPVGVGMFDRSTASENEPEVPEFRI